MKFYLLKNTYFSIFSLLNVVKTIIVVMQYEEIKMILFNEDITFLCDSFI